MNDSAPPGQLWRARPWLWVTFLLALMLTINFYRPRLADGSLQTQWRFRDWRFGPYETRQPFAVAPVDGYVRADLEETIIMVTKGYRLGPLHVFSNWSESKPKAPGANSPPQN